MSRRFNARQRAALFLAADGQCQQCGVELEPGWHADHQHPWSRGGATDVVNGNALCPPCNRKKGNRVELRDWQNDALGRLLLHKTDFLCVATPGAGKTRFALAAINAMTARNEITHVIVVVPTSHLRKQWANAAADQGIQLDYSFVNGNGALARDYDGAVVTYSAVANNPQLWRRLATMNPTLVILDEIHHAGEADHLSWGPALREAFDPAARRLLLSGTPFRSDKGRIPWVRYDGEGKCEPSFNYDYGTALREGGVVRQIAFPAMDGTMRWRYAGELTTMTLAAADGNEVAKALTAAFDPDGDWIESVLRRADEELSYVREEMPDAAGLVVAADQDMARFYAPILERVTGERPAIAVSDDPDASDHITRFAGDRSRWIIAVQMISEGVDIPRLAVGVYASRISTAMFFRQVVGRFVRLRGADDATMATLFIPSIEPLLGYAAEIQNTANAAIADRERDQRDRAEKRDAPRTYDIVEPVDSSEAVHHVTLMGGEAFTDAELRRAENVARLANSRSDIREVALLLRLGGAGVVVGSTTINPAPQNTVTLTERKTDVRAAVNRKVKHLHFEVGVDYAHIHADLNRATGDTIATATLATLNERNALLDRWIREAKP